MKGNQLAKHPAREKEGESQMHTNKRQNEKKRKIKDGQAEKGTSTENNGCGEGKVGERKREEGGRQRVYKLMRLQGTHTNTHCRHALGLSL